MHLFGALLRTNAVRAALGKINPGQKKARMQRAFGWVRLSIKRCSKAQTLWGELSY